MKRTLIFMTLLLTACGPVVHEFKPVTGTLGFPMTAVAPNNVPATPTETAQPEPTLPEPTADIFSALSAPSCSGGATPQDQEGPYYKADTPERNSLLEGGMQGDKLIIIGYVLDTNCLPIAGASVDFWQADADGEYDNEGYTLRGHQFTDEQGRYYLETIMPGIYSSRPIRHIHVKVQAPNGKSLTTQLYFPEQPVNGLTLDLTKEADQYLAKFNFVLP